MGALGAHGEVPPPHSGGDTRVPPVLPGPRRDRDAPWGLWGRTERSLPHTAAVTPESLRSCPGRGGIGTPRGGLRAHERFPPPHSGGYTRVPPVLPGPRRDRDAPWGLGDARSGSPPTQWRLHPGPSGPAWAAEEQGRLWGYQGTRMSSSPTQRRLHPSLSGPPGPRRDRDAPWGFGDARSGSPPTQRRLHPGPSGPAWAAEEQGRPRGYQGARMSSSPTQRRLHPSLSGPPGPRRDRDAPWGFGGARSGSSPTQRR